MDLLRDEVVDFVLAFKPSYPIEGVESHILFQNYLSVVVGESHVLAGRDKISLSELEKFDLAMPARGLQARNAFDMIATEYNYNVRIELNEVNILLELIRQNHLVSVLAEATIHNEQGVKAIPLDIPHNEMEGCVHTLKNAYRKRSMLEFLKLLSESVAIKERQNAWL